MALLGSLGTVGEVMQMAYVVPDLHQAMQSWTRRFGIGPFFWHPESGQTDVIYRGRPAKVDVSFALSYWGSMQIELIQPNDHEPSIYREFLDVGNTALHHVCICAEDMRVVRTRARQAGCEIAHDCKIRGGELVYIDTTSNNGGMFLEVLQTPPGLSELFDRLKAAVTSWDGSDPIRPLF